MSKRIFTRDELDQMGVPDDMGTESDHRPGQAIFVHKAWSEDSRWGSKFDLTFRAPDDGLFWQVVVEEGATEDQEDIDPFDYATEIEGQEVEQVIELVVKDSWVPVEPGTSSRHRPGLSRDLRDRIEASGGSVEQVIEQLKSLVVIDQ
ncbi:hypothetical protein [Rhodococcus qingshengii]|uniref:hypothetical protein n=1 Tax=Rhodococcus qingshengii TaxID=334542 RepID=UPI0035DCECD9